MRNLKLYLDLKRKFNHRFHPDKSHVVVFCSYKDKSNSSRWWIVYKAYKTKKGARMALKDLRRDNNCLFAYINLDGQVINNHGKKQ